MKRYKTLKYFRLLPGNRIRISKSKFQASRHLFEKLEDGSFEIVKFPVGFFPGDVFEVPEMLPGMAKRVKETDEDLQAPGCEPTKPGQLLPQLKPAEKKEDLPEDEGAGPSTEEIQDAIRLLDKDDDEAWTKSGLPAVAAIEAILGCDIDAADRDEALELAEEAGEDLKRKDQDPGE